MESSQALGLDKDQLARVINFPSGRIPEISSESGTQAGRGSACQQRR